MVADTLEINYNEIIQSIKFAGMTMLAKKDISDKNPKKEFRTGETSQSIFETLTLASVRSANVSCGYDPPQTLNGNAAGSINDTVTTVTQNDSLDFCRS